MANFFSKGRASFSGYSTAGFSTAAVRAVADSPDKTRAAREAAAFNDKMTVLTTYAAEARKNTSVF